MDNSDHVDDGTSRSDQSIKIGGFDGAIQHIGGPGELQIYKVTLGPADQSANAPPQADKPAAEEPGWQIKIEQILTDIAGFFGVSRATAPGTIEDLGCFAGGPRLSELDSSDTGGFARRGYHTKKQIVAVFLDDFLPSVAGNGSVGYFGLEGDG